MHFPREPRTAPAPPPMPEQDPEVRRLNEEAELQEREHERAILQGLAGAVTGVVMLVAVVALVKRRKPEPKEPA